MGQRKLSKELVMGVVRNPDFISQSYNFREERYKKFNKNHLKVVTIKEGEKTVVITVHWVAKFKIK